MSRGIATETLLVAGYALFLLVCAFCIERLARHSHARTLRYRTAGFTYHEHLDAWECPEGQHLHLRERDHEARLIRYRARAQVCNACPRKASCTDSDEGREVVRAMDPWPHSEAGRFHRGICLVPVALAIAMLLVEGARHHRPAEIAAVAIALAPALVAAQRMAAAFLASPANFPNLAAGSPRQPTPSAVSVRKHP